MIAQQIGTPDELYERPANLFVAGFIGSPAMNFFPATLTPTGLTLPFGEVTLAPEVQQVIAQHPKPENVIVGVRPEHLADAALIDGYQRIRALTFEVKVDLVESLGADKYVYFTTAGSGSALGSAGRAGRRVRGARKPVSWQGFPPSRRRPSGSRSSWPSTPRKLAVFDADSGVEPDRRRPPE